MTSTDLCWGHLRVVVLHVAAYHRFLLRPFLHSRLSLFLKANISFWGIFLECFCFTTLPIIFTLYHLSKLIRSWHFRLIKVKGKGKSYQGAWQEENIDSRCSTDFRWLNRTHKKTYWHYIVQSIYFIFLVMLSWSLLSSSSVLPFCCFPFWGDVVSSLPLTDK